MTVCIIMPIPPTQAIDGGSVVATPPPPPPPAPPPAPTQPPAPPPGPPLPTVFVDMLNSKVYDAYGIGYSYASIVAQNGLVNVINSAAGTGTATFHTVIQNATASIAAVSLMVTSNLSTGLITPPSPVNINVPASNYVTAVNMLQDGSAGGGTYNVTISVGSTNITIPIGFTYFTP